MTEEEQETERNRIKKMEGTKVTAESFAAWRTAFEAEAAFQAAALVAPKESNSRPSGKEYFAAATDVASWSEPTEAEEAEAAAEAAAAEAARASARTGGVRGGGGGGSGDGAAALVGDSSLFLADDDDDEDFDDLDDLSEDDDEDDDDDDDDDDGDENE